MENLILVGILVVILLVLVTLNKVESFDVKDADDSFSEYLNSASNSNSSSESDTFTRESSGSIQRTDIEIAARALAKEYCPVDPDTYDKNEWVKKTSSECNKGGPPPEKINLEDYILKTACPPQQECPPCICPRVEVSNTDCSNSKSCPTSEPKEISIMPVKTIEKKRDIINLINDLNSDRSPENMDKLIHIKELIEQLNIPESSDKLTQENIKLKKELEYLKQELIEEKEKQYNRNVPARSQEEMVNINVPTRSQEEMSNKPVQQFGKQVINKVKSNGVSPLESVTTLSPVKYDSNDDSIDVAGYSKGLNGSDLPSNLINKCSSNNL